jgi:hypothetical protein
MDISEIPQLGLVYRLMVGDYHYTGSTIDTLRRRISNHRKAYVGGGDDHTRKFYKHLKENGGWDVVKVLVLEKDIEESKLKLREQSFINKDDPFCLNAYNAVAPLVPAKVPVRTPRRKAYDKAYYEAHKEEMKRKRMERYERDKEDPVKYAKILETARKASVRFARKHKDA